MRGDEERVVAAFCEHLRTEGWIVSTEVGYCDVIAERDGSTLYAEAKGRTSSPGLDIDTMYGQVLRRMPFDDDPDARFAVVVPAIAGPLAARVSSRVRRSLRIELYTVDDDGTVTLFSDPPPATESPSGSPGS